MKKAAFISAAVLALFCSCIDDSSSNSSYAFSDIESDIEYPTPTPATVPTVQYEQYVACPMCGGSGILEFMPGDIMAPRMTCSGCNGQGQVTYTQAQQLVQGMNMVNEMMCNQGYTPNGGGSGRSAYEIELELRKANELLYDTQNSYENCTSGVLRTQYIQMISDQKERINRLEAELRNAM